MNRDPRATIGRLALALVLPLALCCFAAHAKVHPTRCPFHAKDRDAAVEVLREYYDHKGPAGKFCEFFSIAFNPSSDDPRLISGALATSDVRSFYLAPEFLVEPGDDDRVSEIMDAVIENEHITTLGLWQKHFSDDSVANVARVLANNGRITSLSIENTKDLTHVGISELAAALESSKIRTLSLKLPPQLQDMEPHHLR